MRSGIGAAAVCILTLLFAGAARAQSGAVKLTSEESTYAEHFLEQPSAQVGLIVRNGCSGSQGLSGRTSYLVRTGVIYWSVNAECVRLVINHRATEAHPNPTYLGVQVIGFYDDPPSASIILRRSGTFVRDAKQLQDYDDRIFSSDQLNHDSWDSLHTNGTLDAVDQKVGTWHGTPLGGNRSSWEDRSWFRRGRSYDAQITLQNRTLDNRLIRFTPYAADGWPKEGPLGFNINRRGARVVVVRVFSPSNADYDRSFALVYESDPKIVATVVNRQVVQSGFSLWFR
jgi:hypothetical protein